MYHSKLEDEQIDGLFVAIQQLETKEEFYRFFEDKIAAVPIKITGCSFHL